MDGLKSSRHISAEEWLAALKLPASDIPDLVVVEGSWWRKQRTDWRLGYLSDVRELAFPDMFWGRWRDRKVVFSCAYGAARTVEIIHLFGILGAGLAVQIGTCGALQKWIAPGDIVLPEVAVCREGVAYLYGAYEAALGSSAWIDQAQALLAEREHETHRGTHLTWCSLFAQDGRMVERWHRAGYLAVDMETATTFAVADYFNMPAVSMLVAWDDLTRNRTFMDPLPESSQQALDRGNESVYEVALELAMRVPEA